MEYELQHERRCSAFAQTLRSVAAKVMRPLRGYALRLPIRDEEENVDGSLGISVETVALIVEDPLTNEKKIDRNG